MSKRVCALLKLLHSGCLCFSIAEPSDADHEAAAPIHESSPEVGFHCRMCRRLLFTDNDLDPHCAVPQHVFGSLLEANSSRAADRESSAATLSTSVHVDSSETSTPTSTHPSLENTQCSDESSNVYVAETSSSETDIGSSCASPHSKTGIDTSTSTSNSGIPISNGSAECGDDTISQESELVEVTDVNTASSVGTHVPQCGAISPLAADGRKHASAEGPMQGDSISESSSGASSDTAIPRQSATPSETHNLNFQQVLHALKNCRYFSQLGNSVTVRSSKSSE